MKILYKFITKNTTTSQSRINPLKKKNQEIPPFSHLPNKNLQPQKRKKKEKRKEKKKLNQQSMAPLVGRETEREREHRQNGERVWREIQ